MISVVCPFFNEEAILDASVRRMLENLALLPEDWELIVVDDGSRDRSLQLARSLGAQERRLRVIGYPENRGRGRHAAAGRAERQACPRGMHAGLRDGEWQDIPG